jgi:dihydrofolate reductase/thymidylate synthase
MKPFSIIVAATANGFGIGRKGDLPWKIAEDMAFFKRVTTTTVANKSNAVIMGRKTYESIPEKFRPLSDRINVVLSKDDEVRQKLGLPDSVLVARSLAEALEMLAGIADRVHDIFVIGGGTVYQEAIMNSSCAKIYLTEIVNDFPDIDTFFPSIPANKFRMTSRSKLQPSKDITFRFTEYVNIGADDEFSLAALPTPAPLPQPTVAGNAEEQQYLDIIRDIIDHGVLRGDRTGTGTISKFGVQMRFSLRNNVFPLLTTKRVFWRGVAEELVWFVRGCTNGNLLAEKDIHIWDGNGSREFLDSRGLHHREVGDLGPVYGFQVRCPHCHVLHDARQRCSLYLFNLNEIKNRSRNTTDRTSLICLTVAVLLHLFLQWRHFGAAYTDMHADYTGQGVDQLRDCIEKIKNSPEDRRIVLTAWNPADLDKMALPPCHMFCQFYVANGELSCQVCVGVLAFIGLD